MPDPNHPLDFSPSTDEVDKQWMARIARGDDTALRLLIEKHQRAVYGTIVKMIGDATEAQDLAQLVFVRIYRAAPTYQTTAQFRTWMFTIVRNLVFNEIRRRSRVRLDSLQAMGHDSAEDSFTVDLPDRQAKIPDQALEQKEMMRAIDQAILALPEQQRLAVILRRYDEFSYEEIAQILHTTVPATKSLLFRARERLRLALEEHLGASEIAA